MVTFKLLLIHHHITSQSCILDVLWGQGTYCKLSYSNNYIYTRVDGPRKTQSRARLHLKESKLKQEQKNTNPHLLGT